MQDAVWVGEDGGWRDDVVEGVGEMREEVVEVMC